MVGCGSLVELASRVSAASCEACLHFLIIASNSSRSFYRRFQVLLNIHLFSINAYLCSVKFDHLQLSQSLLSLL